MYKLLATDMDGTLLTSRRTVSRLNTVALRRASEQGVHVVICTGRGYESARVYGRSMGLKPYIVSANGAVAHDPAGARLFVHPMEPEVVFALIRILRRHRLLFHLFTPEAIVSEQNPPWPPANRFPLYWRDLLEPVSAATRVWSRLASGPRVVPDTTAFVDERGPCIKFFCVELEPGSKEAALAAIRAADLPIEVTSSGEDNVEFTARGVHKGSGLAGLAQLLGVAQSQVVAVGDHHNDLEMLRWAGMGVAVANAIPEAKAAAARVTVSNDEAALDAVVRTIILSK